MQRSNALLIPAILCFVAIMACISLKSLGFAFFRAKGDGADGRSTHTPRIESLAAKHSPTKRERQGDADAKALRELELELDGILPAQMPAQSSSLCNATLRPGETLVLGGFATTDGNFEFTLLEVIPIHPDGTPMKSGEVNDAPSQYKVSAKSLVLSREASSGLGLGSLISPAKTRIQKSVVFPPGESPPIPDAGARITSMPSLTVRKDTAGSIFVGTDKEARVISLILSTGESAGSIRIRTRIESPTEG